MIDGAEGRHLDARLDLPSRPPRGYALFAHCFSCGKDLLGAVRLARTLAQNGVAVLRFDFTGLGGSDGEFGGGLTADVSDLVAAADYLRARGTPAQLLIGHSFGGAAVLAAAGRIPDATAVVTIGAPFAADSVLHQLGDQLGVIEREGEAMVHLAGRPFTIRKRFLDDVRMQDQARRIAELGRPLLVLHSPTDDVVPPENGAKIFAAAAEPRSYVALDGGDHLLGRPGSAEYAAGLIAAWAGRYLAPAPVQTPAPQEEGVVTLEETGEGGFQQAVHAGGVSFFADEPLSVGGSGSGPTPYDLLGAALGACTAMTVRRYADRKGWPLGRVGTSIRHAKVHATDCQSGSGQLDRLGVALRLPGPLSADQRLKLLEVAGRCPVHRTLLSKPEIDVTEQEPSAQNEVKAQP